MALSNYEIMRNQMRSEFIKYDQTMMIQKYSLKNDSEYLYLDFVLRHYRINRKNGIAEWSDDCFRNYVEADYNESMTIHDVLCYGKNTSGLSGKYCSLNMLKGTVKSSTPGNNMFQRAADYFNGKVKELEAVCELMGERVDLKGDVAIKLYPLFIFASYSPILGG